ncbi:FHA domain-containing protein FhaB/FipA [Corynebacterium parakroppenstedtii]|nr:FHA domain-containing protein [Corynebacterium parakroppenstedtii]MDU3198614.1 FHA domain-containing protein [Corynebacterium kroppenstedtii]MBY0789524.1 FHA domain-containing protein [Corynebacterium parakroppenstedtii]MBY0793688.1 FHA domain-containing protein [Corynebacterium parakroppenstedtii]MBY0797063.1 FHA domain-containing protein [Corynebacterium parakroppenstedtii]MCF6772651.1 FHA domain-containing protein [Corynebacterium parakroppenstedtii]
MQSTVLFLVKLAILILLWLFIALTLRALKRDSATPSATVLAAPAVAAPQGGPDQTVAPNADGRRNQRNKAPLSELVVTNGPQRGQTIDLTSQSEVFVGRASSCTLVLSDDYASSRHARFIRNGNDWFVEDLESRNGTYLNEQRIDQLETLTRGDAIRVGRTTLHVQ